MNKSWDVEFRAGKNTANKGYQNCIKRRFGSRVSIIDCCELNLVPGFIDLHDSWDFISWMLMLLLRNVLIEYVLVRLQYQGVTTVMGIDSGVGYMTGDDTLLIGVSDTRTCLSTHCHGLLSGETCGLWVLDSTCMWINPNVRPVDWEYWSVVISSAFCWRFMSWGVRAKHW